MDHINGSYKWKMPEGKYMEEGSTSTVFRRVFQQAGLLHWTGGFKSFSKRPSVFTLLGDFFCWFSSMSNILESSGSNKTYILNQRCPGALTQIVHHVNIIATIAPPLRTSPKHVVMIHKYLSLALVQNIMQFCLDLLPTSL